MKTLRLVLATIVLLFASYSVADCKSEIGNVRTAWMDSWNAKHLDAVIDLYADDAMLLTGTGERLEGKGKIREYFQQLMQSGTATESADTVRTDCAGTMGYDSGNYKQQIADTAYIELWQSLWQSLDTDRP
jgi:ketosteroid isomerase-like protein